MNDIDIDIDIDPASRRTIERIDVNLPGRVIIQGRPPLNCFVRNMSEDGALIEFKAAIWLPARFHVEIPGLDTEAYCEVRHQRSSRVGVSFIRVTVHDAAESTDEADARRIADHWDTVDISDRAKPVPDDDIEDMPPEPPRLPGAGKANPRASAPSRPGSQIRQSISAASRAPVAAGTSGQTPARSWRQRLLGR